MYIPKDIINLRVVPDVNGAMDINMSNNKVVNVADSIGPHDAATKCYTDHLIENLHNLTPTTDQTEYVHYINLRNTTLHSLAGILEVTTDIIFTSKHPNKTGIPHTWVESPTCTLPTMLDGNQDLAGKNITIEFKYPINVEKWNFKMLIEPYTNWDVEYKWQVSNNGAVWHDWTHEKNIKTGKNDWNGNNATLVFNNERYTRYKFWRVLIGAAKTTLVPIYMNYIKMKVTV